MVQAKIECGNFDVMELAPTVQCLTGNIPSSRSARPPFLDLVLESSGSQVLYDTLQSEEGGASIMSKTVTCLLRWMILFLSNSLNVIAG